MIPLLFNLKNKNILVVGGGKIGTRRVETFLENNGKVICISPVFSKELSENKNLNLRLIKKEYEPEDLKGMTFVIAATNHKELNSRIKKEAESYGVYCNRIDDPEDSDFIFPSTLKRGELSISVCTQGASPTLTSDIIKDLAIKYDDSYSERTKLLKICRQKILNEGGDKKQLKILARAEIEVLQRFIQEFNKNSTEKN